MKVDVLTLFPEMFRGPLDESIIKRARNKKLVSINIHNLRNWTNDKHKTVDDRPYGGGAGMILMVEPVYRAIKELKTTKSKIILLTPQGQVFNQSLAVKLAKFQHLIFICGHYEGVDERIRQKLVDLELSIGDYILTGGELPAMVVIDAVSRLIPGVLTKGEAITFESFSTLSKENTRSNKLLEYPQYTRPEVFNKNWKVPGILLSGNHQQIENWRQKQALIRTKSRRPDLLKSSH